MICCSSNAPITKQWETTYNKALVVGKSLVLTGWNMVTDASLLQLTMQEWEQSTVEEN